MTFDRWESGYVNDAGVEVRPLGRVTRRCPRCNEAHVLLRRPSWRTDGPKICSLCIRDEQRDAIEIEREKEAREHAREVREYERSRAEHPGVYNVRRAPYDHEKHGDI